MRQLSRTDFAISALDSALRSLLPVDVRTSSRCSPAKGMDDTIDKTLSSKDKQHVNGLMRVNHAGEICAQALYHGQALTAKNAITRNQMAHAAEEELDHLAWCEGRLKELGGKPSALNPVWYSGALMIGILAGIAGDKWSLGFVAETERQVEAHLKKHLQSLPGQDKKTAAILKQMQLDEAGHADLAMDSGAAMLPGFVKTAMRYASKIMTSITYYT